MQEMGGSMNASRGHPTTRFHAQMDRPRTLRLVSRITAMIVAAIMALLAPAAALADTVSNLAGETLGSGYAVYTSRKVDLTYSKELCLEKIRSRHQDALDDPNVKWDDMAMPKHLVSIGMSMEDYLNPKWSNALERIALQRTIEAESYSYAHTRLNGTSCFTATYNNFSSSSEVLGWDYGTVPNCIDNGWAAEKAAYLKALAGEEHWKRGTTHFL